MRCADLCRPAAKSRSKLSIGMNHLNDRQALTRRLRHQARLRRRRRKLALYALSLLVVIGIVAVVVVWFPDVLVRFYAVLSRQSGSTLLLVGAGAVGIVWVLFRWRMMLLPELSPGSCPRCQARAIRRVRRTPLDRMISVFVPVRRYHCGQCNWYGRVIKPTN